MVDRYLSEPLIDYKKNDPLKWWQDNVKKVSFIQKYGKEVS